LAIVAIDENKQKDIKLLTAICANVLLCDDRGKNAQALVDLELRPVDQKPILEALENKDYSEKKTPEKNQDKRTS
jgi:hypothetical protein